MPASLSEFEPRDYQEEILEKTTKLVQTKKNVILELDCGLGKRFIQLELIRNKFHTEKIILLLQASTSAYETFNYLKKYFKEDIGLLTGRTNSKYRNVILNQKRVVLSLPQTLMNTLTKFPDALNEFNIIIINEVDQIIKRFAETVNLKHPYLQLFSFFKNKRVIGMSGTLRDDHYVLNDAQIKMIAELKTLSNFIENSTLISMDSLQNTDINSFINLSKVIATGVDDQKISFISFELEQYIEEAKNKIMDFLKKSDPQLYWEAKNDFSVLFGPLPVDEKLIQRFHRGYLTRKYLWAMSGEKSRIHLIRYGLGVDYIDKNLPYYPNKFRAVCKLVKNHNKSVILCSYLDAVDTIEKVLNNNKIDTIKVTGKIAYQKRYEELEKFKNAKQKMVAILSNVGERDLDIPEADLLIVFDLIRTTKTVYQKLKRSRGGECRILFYNETKEYEKVTQVLNKIEKKYYWSTKILPSEVLES